MSWRSRAWCPPRASFRAPVLGRAVPAMAAVVAAVALWLIGSPLAAAAQSATSLSVSGPVEMAAGDSALIEARLTDGAGNGVEAVKLELVERARFLNVFSRAVLVTRADTDAGGVARLMYTASREGSISLGVRFAGTDELAATTTEINIPVGPGGQMHVPHEPGGIPGVNRFLLSAILGGVWITMLVVALYVVGIARESSGDDAAASRSWLLRWGAPATYTVAVLLIGSTLVSMLVRSPDTKGNLLAPEAEYTRTFIPSLGDEVPFDAFAPRAGVPPRTAAVGADEPNAMYVRAGCASCHGLRGEGGVVGPDIWKKNAEDMLEAVREGDEGMPAFADGWLSDEQIGLLSVHLRALSERAASDTGAADGFAPHATASQATTP